MRESGPSTRLTCTRRSSGLARCSKASAIRERARRWRPRIKLHAAIAQAFASAAARSTLVQLRDHTWIPYVPSEAFTYRRILDQWYPTDVDTGAVHLLRLKAVPANGELADSLLNDHEDNLFLKGWGMANEPVYNQQGTAYLLRDDPKAAIRTFYSYMAVRVQPVGVRAGRASLDARPVLRAAEHGWRLVRTVPQHAGA